MFRISLLRHLRESKKASGSSGRKKKPFRRCNEILILYTKSRHQTGTTESDEDQVCENYSQMKNSQSSSYEEESVNSSNIPHKNIEESQEVNEVGISDLLENLKDPFMPTNLTKETPHRFPSKKRTIQSTENWEHSAVQYLTALSNKYNTKKKQSSDEEDGNLLFLRSLLPDLKKLTDAQKRRFKQRIFVLYDEIVNEDSECSTVHATVQFTYSSAASVSSYDSDLTIFN